MVDYKRIVVQWKELELPNTLPRNIGVELSHDFITTITGPRRAGKTFLCFQLMKQLFEKRVSKENVLYVNFEDEKLLGANAEDLNGILDAFFELTNIDKKQNIFLFLDEIQNVENWDAWIRRIYDTHKNIKIILTGSSSKLLSKEISTSLRGRVINIEVFPLSFKEFLAWKKIKYELKTVLYSKERFVVKKEFDEYLINGGYPAIVFNKPLREQVLQNYLESMIFKDIIERHNLKEIKKLKILVKILFASTAKEISYNKIANKLKSIGLSISKNTIIEYISYFDDAYLFFQNLKYEYSLTKQLGSMKKIYCIDNGLLNAVSFKFSDDTGKLLENLVFIELKRRKKEVYFNKNKHECDFLIKTKNKVTETIQVTKELNEDNYTRETTGLIEAMKKFKLKNGIILTLEQSEEKKIDGKQVKIIPIWKWLLEKNSE